MKVQIAVEEDQGRYWGRCNINGSLITDDADSKELLFDQMKKLVMASEGLSVDEFEEVKALETDEGF